MSKNWIRFVYSFISQLFRFLTKSTTQDLWSSSHLRKNSTVASLFLAMKKIVGRCCFKNFISVPFDWPKTHLVPWINLPSNTPLKILSSHCNFLPLTNPMQPSRSLRMPLFTFCSKFFFDHSYPRLFQSFRCSGVLYIGMRIFFILALKACRILPLCVMDQAAIIRREIVLLLHKQFLESLSCSLLKRKVLVVLGFFSEVVEFPLMSFQLVGLPCKSQ